MTKVTARKAVRKPKGDGDSEQKTPKPAQRVPTLKETAAFIGVPLRAPLKPDQARRLLKPLPGYRAVMDNVAKYLREDNHVLELPYDPDEVIARLGHAKILSCRNALLQEVLAGSEAERQIEDGFLMKVLLDAVKRVKEESGTHPELRQQWREILDFVHKNRPGRTGGGSSATSRDSAPVT